MDRAVTFSTLAALAAALAVAGCGEGVSGLTAGQNVPLWAARADRTEAVQSAARSGSYATSPVYHPSANGDTFAYAGGLSIYFYRNHQYPTPEPVSTTFANVSQAITVTNPATFNGFNDAIDFHTVEQDQQTKPVSETFSSTIDNYFHFSGTPTSGNFYTLGFHSTDATNYQVTFTFGSGNGLIDELPEIKGASWTNDAAATILTNSPDGQSSSQTINADGTYQETITYQQQPGAPGGLTNQATIQANLDGSGTYDTPRLGTERANDYVYAVATPDAAKHTITETTTIPPAANSTASPSVVSTTVPDWIPKGVLGSALATETDTDLGPQKAPLPCPTASPIPAIQQLKNRVDPMLGELETTKTTTYVIPNVGPACVAVLDVLLNYYDFSGQNGVGYFAGAPQQKTIAYEILVLKKETIKDAQRDPRRRAQIQQEFRLRVSAAQARIVALHATQRQRLLRASATSAGAAHNQQEGPR